MILVIDNQDSFVFNLVQMLGELGADVQVRRNDAITVDEITALKPRRLLISPGPGRPEEAGITLEALAALAQDVPTLGVCLGHQALAQLCGGRVVRGPEPVHGKTSVVHHGGDGLFRGLPDGFPATRYHSLHVERDTLPDCLAVTAATANGTVMGLRHRAWPAHGVQFHPESILTRHGHALLRNFLEADK